MLGIFLYINSLIIIDLSSITFYHGDRNYLDEYLLYNLDRIYLYFIIIIYNIFFIYYSFITIKKYKLNKKLSKTENSI